MPNLFERHLTEEERRLLHNPKPDYIATDNGDVCRNSSSLTVDDLVKDIIIKRPKVVKKKTTSSHEPRVESFENEIGFIRDFVRQNSPRPESVRARIMDEYNL